VEKIKVNDVVINWVENLHYLDVCMKLGRTFKLDLHENRANFYSCKYVSLIGEVGTKMLLLLCHSLRINVCHY